MDKLFEKYLRVLGIIKNDPDIKLLTQLIKAHLSIISFENISKLYYLKKYNLKAVPDFDLYLDGISRYHFGGTCYSNNYYLNRLLNYLGYEVLLCGADMNNPDVHVVNIVTLEDREYLVDVGYAAPFLNPIPLDLTDIYEIVHGADKYVLYPRNVKGYSELKMFRDGEEKHGYVVKPIDRSIDEFAKVIKGSFRESATFLNSLLLVRFGSTSSVSIHNFSIVESRNGHFTHRDLKNKEELIGAIAYNFSIPDNIVTEIVEMITVFGDSWN